MTQVKGFGDNGAELVDVAGRAPAEYASALDPADRGAPDGHQPAPGEGEAESYSVAGNTVIPHTEIVIRPSVSVIVCAFTEERWDDIRRVVASLRAQTEEPSEIILVIDHCPALLLRARHAFPDVTIVPNHFQKGLAGGRNTGVAHAWGDVIAFIDDDAVADPQWLTRLADHYLDPTVLGVGGLVEPAWDQGRPGWFPPELDWVVGCSYLGMRSGLGPIRNFIGANMSFRRETLAEVGGFAIELGRVDSNPFGCEETELCLRVSQRYPDGVLLYEPEAAVRHRVGEKRARWRYLRSRCYAEGRSKATVASLAGAESALASERSYVRSTIPRGVGRSLWQAVRGRPSGLLSAFALMMAVLVTGFGYCVGLWYGRKNPGSAAVEQAEAAVADAESWVLDSEHTVPDPQIWVLDPDNWLPDVEDWAPGRPGLADGPQVPDGDTGTRAPAGPLAPARALAPARPAQITGAPRRVTGQLHAWAGMAFPWASLAVIAGLWVSGLNRAQVAKVPTAGFGLVSVLPVTFWAAAALLMLSFCWTVVRWPARRAALAAHLVILVLILHATPTILYGTLRYSWAWKHVGVVDYIVHHGIDFNLGGVLGVYQGWPGFFALNAFLTSDGGLQSALSYAPWALVVNDLLWLGPVLLIAGAVTRDQRMIWTTAWVFELGNWVGQDYFSPQAFAFFLYLTVIAVCLRWLGDDRPPPRLITAGLAALADLAHGRRPERRPAGRWKRRRASAPAWWQRMPGSALWLRRARNATAAPDMALPPEGGGVSGPMRLAMVASLVPLMAAIASSHQLTPLMLAIALVLLAVSRHLQPRWLPLLMLVITLGWILYGGLPWLEANNSQVSSGFGSLWANSSAHLVGGAQVPYDQVIVERGARLLSAAIGVMAVAGFLRYRRGRDRTSRRSWNRIALLGVAAIPTVAGNSYGGEIIFRAFLFALPFMAVAAGALFFPRPALRGYLAGGVLAVTTLGLAGGFFLSNYGTDAMNYFTPQEVAASRWLYRTAPNDAQLIAINSGFPWAFVHYNQYSYTFLDGLPSKSGVLRAPVRFITALMTPPNPRDSYLVLTQSQAAQETIGGPWSPSQVQRVYRAVLASNAFEAVYRSHGVVILRLAHTHGNGAVPPAHQAARAHRRAAPHGHKVRHQNRTQARALRARYHRHHPPTIGGRPVMP